MPRPRFCWFPLSVLLLATACGDDAGGGEAGGGGEGVGAGVSASGGAGGTVQAGGAGGEEPLPEADFYVRVDGDDSCDGTVDAPAGGEACAWRTIGRALETANCGDIVQLGAGDFPTPPTTIAHSCPADSPLTLRGLGREQTWWMGALRPVLATSCDAGSCAWPVGAVDYEALSDNDKVQHCVVQRAATGVRFEDENGVKGDLVGPVCVTPNTTGSLAAGQVRVTGDVMQVQPFNGQSPAEADLWAPDACDSSGALDLAGDGLRIDRLSLVSGCGRAVALRGRDDALTRMDVYTGTVWLFGQSERAELGHLRILNNYRRPVNMAATSGGQAWSTNNQSLAVQGRDFLIHDLETYGSREGAGFSGGAREGLVDGAIFHGHHNHGLKVIDVETQHLTFRDVLSYNAQETLFVECPRDIVFESSTFPQGKVVIQGNPSLGCTPARLSFFNDVLCGITWFAYGGDTWAEPGGHQLDHNVYVSDHPSCGGSYRVRHIPSDTNFTLTAWQGWSQDPCADCLRDPNSITASVDDTFTQFVVKDDTLGAGADFRPPMSFPGIDQGDPAHADAYDLDGTPRQGAPDIGAYEPGG